MDIKLTEALDALETKLKGATTLETKTLLTGFKESFDAELKAKENAFEAKSKEDKEAASIEIKGLKELQEVQQKHLDALDVKLKSKTPSSTIEINSLISKNIKDIALVTKSSPFMLEVKDMTLANALTGDQPRDYNFDVVKRPYQMANVEDLANTIAISGGTYTYVRSTLASGAVAEQTEGAVKAQLEYDYAMIDANTNYIAGFAVYSKKMRNNLPFLESTLSIDLRNDYLRGENTIFAAILAAQATASTQVITGKNKIEMLIGELADLATKNFMATDIVVTPADWYSIMVTEVSTGAGYGLPGIVTFDGGTLRINGVRVVMATWLAANKYYVGDWSRVRKPVTEGFTFAVSEDDSDNFRKNNLTARVEAQVTLTVEQPDALTYGDFTAV
tara:strand:+ start:114 stop:1283 length:1170 start_codon:yes stop_codon:yes gene_type:complete